MRKRRSMARPLRESSSRSAERLQCLCEAQVLNRGVGDHLIELFAHRRQAELIQFQFQGGHKSPFGIAE